MRFTPACLLIVPAFLIATSGCAGSGGGVRRQPPVAVDTVPVARRDLTTHLTFDGQIVPLLNATLSSPQSGNVVAVYVDEGDRVRRGQLLAKIDDAVLRAELAQAEGQIASASGQMRGAAITQPIQSAQYGSTLSQAQASVDADEAALRNAKLVYDSNARLYPQGYVAQTAFEQARAAYIAARQQLTRDRSALQAARADLGRSQADIQGVEAYRGTLEQAYAAARQLRVAIAQTEIRAPFSGVITARTLDPGAFASPNAPVLTLSDVDTVYVGANIPDNALEYVRPGTEATFATASLPGDAFHGKMYDVNAVPTQGTLSYRARIRYANTDGLLRGGMLVNVVVTKERRVGVPVVPRTAIFQTNGGNHVVVVRENTAVSVPVTVGLQTDTEAEVRGVRPGERVVVTHPDMVRSGAQVAANGGGSAR